VDNALLIHRYGLPANTKLKDEPQCPATAVPVCRAPRISSRSICSIVAATCWSAISTYCARRCAPRIRVIRFTSMLGSSYLTTVHCVWTLPDGEADFALRWQVIKFAFARRLPKTEILTATHRSRGERGIWQRRYWEHLIQDERDYRHHVDYVHLNPLKHGLVKRVVDWRHSSFHRAVAFGVYPADWCGDQAT